MPITVIYSFTALSGEPIVNRITHHTAAEAVAYLDAIKTVIPGEVDAAYANTAVAVALDVLQQITRTSFRRRSYIHNMPPGDHQVKWRGGYKKETKLGQVAETIREHCPVCALGACLLSASRLGRIDPDVCQVLSADGGGYAGATRVHVMLDGVFDVRTRGMIESAFEGSSRWAFDAMCTADEARAASRLWWDVAEVIRGAPVPAGVDVYEFDRTPEGMAIAKEVVRLVMSAVAENVGALTADVLLALSPKAKITPS